MNIKPVTGVLKTLTWIKISQLVILMFAIMAFWLFWVFRADVYTSMKMGALNTVTLVTSIDVSPKSRSAIVDIINKNPTLIAGIQVVNVDFKRNVRSSSYFAFSDVNLQISVQDYLNTSVAETPLFTDVEPNNRQIIDLVNGEFICNDFKDTIAGKIYYNGSTSVSTVCSISIPPHYGKFSGYLNIYLKRKPDEIDRDTIRQMAREISESIYTNDIIAKK
jgi:hypothetical protein